MSVLLRSNIPFRGNTHNVGGTQMGGGGDGRYVPGNRRTAKVRPKVRYSADPAAELMPAAEFLGTEPDFGAILEDFKDSPFDPSKRSVLGKLMGVFAMDYQGARSAERAFLRRLLRARNAREGYAANCALHLTQTSHAIRRTLALGVAEARWDKGPVRGFLGAVQARLAANTFALLGPKGRELLWNLLTVAGRDDEGKLVSGADPVIERALILKALAARRHRLGPWIPEGAQALAEVQRFAQDIRGVWRLTLAQRTTLHSNDPNHLTKKVQDATQSQSAMLIGRADIDPVFAWGIHDAEAKARGAGVEAAQGAQTYEDIYAALPDLDRSPLQNRPRIHQALAESRAGLYGDIQPYELVSLTDYLSGRDLGKDRSAQKNSAVEKIQLHGYDVMTQGNLEAIRDDAQGIYQFDAATAFGTLVSRYSGAVYVRRMFSDLMTAGLSPTQLIGEALRCGLAVPMLVKEARKEVLQAWLALAVERLLQKTGVQKPLGEHPIMVRHPQRNEELDISLGKLSSALLPDSFGSKARADTYLAPAGLDLIAPPFGITFPRLGVKDTL